MASTDSGNGFDGIRRAYERGRLLRAARVLPVIGVAVLVSLLGCWHCPMWTASPVGHLLLGLGLAGVAVAALWRGEDYGAAVYPALLAGTAPLLVPYLIHSGRMPISSGGLPHSVVLTALAGLIAGAVVGAQAGRLDSTRALATGYLIAGLMGALGCIVAGLAGVVGMALAATVSAAPIYLAHQLRR